MSLYLQVLEESFRKDMTKMVEIELGFQNNLSHIFQLNVSEGKDLFISGCRKH